MAAATEPLLMTVEQYRQLPDREDVIQELHWGMVVTLSRPKMRHAKLQSRLVMPGERSRQLPDRKAAIQKLHWGMVVALPRPKRGPAKLQSRLGRLQRQK